MTRSREVTVFLRIHETKANLERLYLFKIFALSKTFENLSYNQI